MLQKKDLSWRRSAWKLWDFWLEGFSDNLRQQLESIWLLRSSLEGRKPSSWISSPCRGVRISPPIGGAVCSWCWEEQQSHKQQIWSHPWKETPTNESPFTSSRLLQKKRDSNSNIHKKEKYCQNGSELHWPSWHIKFKSEWFALLSHFCKH